MVLAGESSQLGNAGLYIVNADGRGLQHIANTLKGDRAPSMSPDGKRIAFVGAEDSDDGISVINIDGTGRTRLTAGGTSADDDVPSWSPDGRRILFLRDDAPGYLLFTIAADGSDPHQVTKISDSTDEMIRPGWSPDGQYIVFEDAAPPDNARDIYVIHADGSGRVRLGAPGRPVQDYQPSWDPRGYFIAFVEQAGTDVALFVMPANGGGGRRLIALTPASTIWPAWSPDGGRIAFELPDAGYIVVMNSGGGDSLRMALPGVFHTPSWTTAGASLIYIPPLPTPTAAVSPTP
jgi:Tol biopolymer transport system component